MHTRLTQTRPLFAVFFFKMSLIDWKYMSSKKPEESKSKVNRLIWLNFKDNQRLKISD